jgi:hypothetical protein
MGFIHDSRMETRGKVTQGVGWGNHSRKSTMITIVIPRHLIRCKTVVSTTVVRTQGLGAPINPVRVVDWVVVMTVMRVEAGRTRTSRGGPYSPTLQGTHLHFCT